LLLLAACANAHARALDWPILEACAAVALVCCLAHALIAAWAGKLLLLALGK
jgi:hypothetical protein